MLCMWCEEKEVKEGAKYCSTDCRVAALVTRVREEHIGRPSLPLEEKAVALSINLTAEQAIAACSAGGGKKEFPLSKVHIRRGIKRMLETSTK